MKKALILLLALSVRGFAVTATQDAAALDTKALLNALKEIKTKHTEAAKSQRSKVLQELTAAASSNSNAIAFYLEAMKTIAFAGESRAQTMFMEWKKKEAERIKSPEMQTAVRFHLSYLALTLQYANGLTIPQMIPALIHYTEQVSAADRAVTQQEVMRRSVRDGMFVKWFNIENQFGEIKDWELVPGNVDGMWQKTILPQMRKDKDQRVITYWDNKIKIATEVMSESKRAFDIDQFNAIHRPELLWSRAKDLIAIGQRNRGIGEMFTIVKTWPDHPENAAWIQKIEDILTGKDTGIDG